MKGIGKLLTYAVLMGIGCTMLIPFLWMCSSALKPEDQVFRNNWIPSGDFLKVDGTEYRIGRRQLAADGAGRYQVRITQGARAGEQVTVSTAQLTAGKASGVFIYTPQVDAPGVPVELIKKIQPNVFLVWATQVNGQASLSGKQVSEFDIHSRPLLRWSNFVRAIKVSGVFGRAYINSLLVAILITLGQVFTSALAAYAFARLRFPLRDTLFLGYLATMMIPAAITMIPVFVILKGMPELLNTVFGTSWWTDSLFLSVGELPVYLGRPIGLDSYFALIVPGLFSAYGTFMLRQFFMSLPRDLEDAARIDGCSSWGIFCNVILPLSKPALAALTIFTFMGAWRSFLWPLVVSSSPEMQVLPVMLQSFMGVIGTQWNLLMAGTLLVLAPMIVVFLVGQRFFVAGIQLGAIKG